MSRLDDLYARYRKPLIAKLVQFGQSEAEAADIAQETLIATWKRLDAVEAGREWAYLLTAAFNLARKKHARANVPRHGAGRVTPLESDHDAPDRARSVEAELIDSEEIVRFRERFHAAMAELEPKTRQALVLKKRGATSREIAERVGLTDQAVRTRVSRACALLRERVGPPPADVHWADLLGEDDDDHQT